MDDDDATAHRVTVNTCSSRLVVDVNWTPLCYEQMTTQ